MRQGLSAVVLAMSVFGLWGGGDEIQVTQLTRDGVIYVSFTHATGMSDDMRTALRSGLPLTITYEVDLCRVTPVWFDKTVGSVTVTASAQYDNLTRLHQLSRTIDGRGEEPLMTGDEEVVRRWLTAFERLPLFRTANLEPNAEYYIRVRARSRPRLTWFVFWPFERGAASGYAHFTFLPS